MEGKNLRSHRPVRSDDDCVSVISTELFCDTQKFKKSQTAEPIVLVEMAKWFLFASAISFIYEKIKSLEQ